MSDTVRTEFDLRADDTPFSVAIVQAVAEAKGTAALGLDTNLHDVVDPDALRSVFSSPKSGRERLGHVSFPFEEMLVSLDVGCDDSVSITVEPRNADGGAPPRGECATPR